VTSDFLAWLDRGRERPFFAFLNYFDAHDPYLPERLHPEDRELTRKEKLLMQRWRHMDPADLTEQDVLLAQRCYASLIRELDLEVGRLVDELQQRGMWENTLFIVTSDHGELFGEHDVFYHGNNLHRPAVHVPLLIRGPQDIASTRRVAVPVTLRDLASTILDMVGLHGDTTIPGNSLAPFLRRHNDTERVGPSVVFATVNRHPRGDCVPMFSIGPSSKGTLHSLLSENYYLIRESDGTRRVYDFRNDTLVEETEVSRQPEEHDRLDKLDDRLDAFLSRNGDGY
jgi:arylsulfatase A-like enzyme